MLMICVTGANRLGRWVCGDLILALHGDGWASWRIENLGKWVCCDRSCNYCILDQSNQVLSMSLQSCRRSSLLISSLPFEKHCAWQPNTESEGRLSFEGMRACLGAARRANLNATSNF